MKKHKLRLDRTTVQELCATRTAEVRGGMDPGTGRCWTQTCFTCNTNCCLIVPGTDV